MQHLFNQNFRSYSEQEIRNLPKANKAKSNFMKFYDSTITDDIVLKLPSIILGSMYMGGVIVPGYILLNCGESIFNGSIYGAFIGAVTGGIIGLGPGSSIGVSGSLIIGVISGSLTCLAKSIYDEMIDVETVELPVINSLDELNNEHQKFLPITPEMIRFLDQQLNAIDYKREPEFSF